MTSCLLPLQVPQCFLPVACVVCVETVSAELKKGFLPFPVRNGGDIVSVPGFQTIS